MKKGEDFVGRKFKFRPIPPGRIFRTVRNQSGTLTEFPLLIASVLIFLAVVIPFFLKHGLNGSLLLVVEIVLGIGALWGLLAAYLYAAKRWPVVELVVDYSIGIAFRFLLVGLLLMIGSAFFYFVFPDQKLLQTVGAVIEITGLLAWSFWSTYRRRNLKPEQKNR